MKTDDTVSLFDKLGGASTVRALVDKFYARMLADPRVNHFFAGTHLPRQKAHMAAFITTALGGPKEYAGRDMRSAHFGMGITDADFDATAENLVNTLKEMGVGQGDIETIVGTIAPLRAQVVEGNGRPGNGRHDNPESAMQTATNRLKEAAAQHAVEDFSRQMLDAVPVNVMMCDLDCRITYANPASLRTLRNIQHLLPVPPERVVGSSIDIFHKNPAHQRRLLADPRNLPHQANIRLGNETLDLQVIAVRDSSGRHAGSVVVWSVITEKLRTENEIARIRSMVDKAPIN
ncbi:MAG: PAS domain-containing protein, partial [Planctomycetes bacterium]|nr:PAS domain-containing protein [Planctomycetota bacterium]